MTAHTADPVPEYFQFLPSSDNILPNDYLLLSALLNSHANAETILNHLTARIVAASIRPSQQPAINQPGAGERKKYRGSAKRAHIYKIYQELYRSLPATSIINDIPIDQKPPHSPVKDVERSYMDIFAVQPQGDEGYSTDRKEVSSKAAGADGIRLGSLKQISPLRLGLLLNAVLFTGLTRK